MAPRRKKNNKGKRSGKAKKKAGRASGSRDFVYVTRDLIGHIFKILEGGDRDKNFRVSQTWLKSCGYDLVPVGLKAFEEEKRRKTKERERRKMIFGSKVFFGGIKKRRQKTKRMHLFQKERNKP